METFVEKFMDAGVERSYKFEKRDDGVLICWRMELPIIQVVTNDPAGVNADLIRRLQDGLAKAPVFAVGYDGGGDVQIDAEAGFQRYRGYMEKSKFLKGLKSVAPKSHRKLWAWMKKFTPEYVPSYY